jgi:purine-cytosine permease-like protein
MRTKNSELQACADELHARIQRLRRWVMLLVATSLAIGVPATFLWGKGGYAMFGDSERTSKTVVLLGLGAGACAIVAALLALRIVRLSDSLPRGR